MTYKRKNASHWERLWGVYHCKGYVPALAVYRALPKRPQVLTWRALVFLVEHWKTVLGVVLKLLGK
ncbi:hypothetical protein [Pulveribacter sp.]|uniref:hypothetical protein n=1 Tax=Pulveribacter sp. TaxID=2678893 RepID=UPI00289DF4D9|nr:hypothetical protein [Pulveribacter sp.]